MKALFTAIAIAAATTLAQANGPITENAGPDSLAIARPHTTASGLYHHVFAPTNKSKLVKIILAKPESAAPTRLRVYGPDGALEYTAVVKASTSIHTLDMSAMEAGSYRFEFRNGSERVVDEVAVR